MPSHAWGSRQAAVSPVRTASGVAGNGAATGFSASLASTPARVVGAMATPSSYSMPAARALGFPTPSSRGATGSLSASLPSAALDIHARYAMMQRLQQVRYLGPGNRYWIVHVQVPITYRSMGPLASWRASKFHSAIDRSSFIPPLMAQTSPAPPPPRDVLMPLASPCRPPPLLLAKQHQHQRCHTYRHRSPPQRPPQ